MWGSLVGDCIGSFWEFSGNKDPAIPLWVPACRFTDDSVCTGAIAAWLTERDGEGLPLQTVLHRRARANMSSGFGDRMVAWILSENPKPYGSWGNGAAMRVSPIALFARSTEEALRLAEISTHPTHDHHESVRGAQATVLAIRHAFEHRNPEALLAFVEQRFGYEGLTTRRHEEERATHVFDVSCKGTVPLAEALYGIPLQHVENARRRYHVEDDIWEAVASIYALPHVQEQLAGWKREGGTVIEETDPRRVHRLGERMSAQNAERQSKAP